MRRATNLDSAIRELKNPYTYTIIPVSEEKKKNRVLVGTMSAEMLESVRDQLINAAIYQWNKAHATTTGESTGSS